MAEVVSGTGFDTLILELVKYGVFGVLFGLLIIAYREKLKELNTLWKERIEDNKQVAQVATTTNKMYEELARSMNSRGQTMEHMGEAQSIAAKALEKQAELLDLIRRIAEANGNEMRRITETQERTRRDLEALTVRTEELLRQVTILLENPPKRVTVR